MTLSPLVHADLGKSDERLAAEAGAYLSKHPALQLVAELYTRLRDMRFPWWTPEQLRIAYPASERMAWLTSRPDIRQRITTELTGLAPRAARNKSPAFQAELIDSVVDEGDISPERFESAFEPADLVVYGSAARFWALYRKRMPWDDDATPHQDIVGWLIGALLADKSTLDGAPRRPILTALAARTAIDGRVWHTRIPLNVRVAIDEARFAHQREHVAEGYGVERDLQIATPALIAASVPLKDLLGVLDVASEALGLEAAPANQASGREASAPEKASDPKDPDDGPRVEVAVLSDSQVDEGAIAESLAGEGGSAVPETHDTVDPPAVSTEEASSEEVPQEPELDHTSPWAVPALSGEMARVANELRGKSSKRRS